MLSMQSKFLHRLLWLAVLVLSLISLSGCDSEPPALMKASKQFESDEIRDRHVAHMRKNHMDELLHKRDQTMYKGIRTKKYSLNACIDCHVPEQHNGEVLRHTNPEHFCSTCHGYVAAQLDCFQCHADHPVKDNSTADINTENLDKLSIPSNNSKQVNITDIALTTNENQGESASE